MGDSIRQSIEAYSNKFVSFKFLDFFYEIARVYRAVYQIWKPELEDQDVEQGLSMEDSSYEENQEWYQDGSKVTPERDEAPRATEHFVDDDILEIRPVHTNVENPFHAGRFTSKRP